MYLHRLYVAWRLPTVNNQQRHVPLKVERCKLFARFCAFHTIRNRPLTSALWAGMDRIYHSQQILISTPSGIKNTSTVFGCDQLRAPTALFPGSSGVPRGVWGVQNPTPRNSEDIGAVLDRMSKKNRRLEFLL